MNSLLYDKRPFMCMSVGEIYMSVLYEVRKWGTGVTGGVNTQPNTLVHPYGAFNYTDAQKHTQTQWVTTRLQLD